MAEAAERLGVKFMPTPPSPPSGSEGIAARYLAQMARQGTVDEGRLRGASETGERQIQVKNDVNMRVEAVTTPVYLDGTLIGEFLTKFLAHDAMLRGVPVTP